MFNYFEVHNNKPNPLHRFVARMIDLTIFTLPLLLILPLERFSEYLIVVFAPVFIESIYEAACISIFGTTIGKFLFGIYVREDEISKITFGYAFKRALKIWTIRVGLNIPILSAFFLLTQLASWDNTTNIARWDETEKCKVFFVRRKFDLNKLVVAFGLICYIAIICSVQLLTMEAIGRTSFFAGFEDKLEVLSTFSSNKAKELNEKGYQAIINGEYRNAKNYLLQALSETDDPQLHKVIYDNLSWASYKLGEYEKAIEYSEKCLAFGDNDAIHYVNYGNALLEYGRNRDAETAFLKSLKIEETSEAYYGLGITYYDRYYYDKAIEYFLKCLELDYAKGDSLVYLFIAYCNIYKGDYNSAIKYLDKASEIEPEAEQVLNGYAKYYTFIEDNKSLVALYEKMVELFPKKIEYISMLAECYYQNERVQEAFELIDNALDSNKRGFYELMVTKAKLHYWSDDLQAVNKTIEELIADASDLAYAYYNAGNICYYTYQYMEAVNWYKKALEEDPEYEDCYIACIISLYDARRRTQLIELANEVIDEIDSYYIPLYLGYVYSDLYEHEKAISYYEQALKYYPDDLDIMLSIGWEYYYLQDYDKAKIWLNTLMQINSEDIYVLDYKKSVDKACRPMIEQVTEFIEENYLYYKENDEYKELKASLRNKDIDSDDVYELVLAVYEPTDEFSYMLDGVYFEEYMAYTNSNTVECRTLDDENVYIKIEEFLPNTSNEFIDCIDDIEDPSKTNLIIDLRDNYGGDTTSGCEILDALLDECSICTIVDRDGEKNDYYSDPQKMEFNHIYILTNKESASCSELLTLALKSYLDNVTVIGETTYGKGVGQYGFISKSKKFVLYLVSHYWDVDGKNIMNVGVEPDIYVSSSNLEDYLKVIK